MSAEQNKAIMRQMVEEVFNRGDISKADNYLAPNFVEREELPPGVPRDREGVKMLVATFRSAFPDFKATINDLIAEGDKVVIRMTWSGTQKGEFMGMPATGKSISINVIDIIRFDGDKAAEHWGVMDSMLMMQQLGAIPAPEQA